MPMQLFKMPGSLFAASLAALGASVCCVGPLVLLALGVGGAWVSTLTALEPLRLPLTIAALTFPGLAFWSLQRKARSCEPGTPCADPRVRRRQQGIFWLVTLVLLLLLAAPWAAPWFY